MGLFSFQGKKNKQESASGESEFYSRAEDESQAMRSKRRRGKSGGSTKSAGRSENEPADPVLPEKKRARRRLVGAVALVLAVVIGLPMVLDSEPKPLPDDIAIQIPSKDKAPALPNPTVNADVMTAAPQGAAPDAQAGAAPEANAPATGNAEDAPAANAKPAGVTDARAVAATTVAAATATGAAVGAIGKTDIKKDDAKAGKTAEQAHAQDVPKSAQAGSADVKPAAKTAAAKADVKSEAKMDAKADKVSQHASHDDARAEAILAGKDVDAGTATVTKKSDKSADKTADKSAGASAGKFSVQVAALASQDKVNELRGKLSSAGFKSYTQKVPTTSGDRIRVRIGPFASKSEADSAVAKLGKLGLNGKLVSS